MSQMQRLFHHRRTALTRLAALLVLGLGGLLIVLPRAGAHGVAAGDPAAAAPTASLLSPERLSGPRFGQFYARTIVGSVDF